MVWCCDTNVLDRPEVMYDYSSTGEGVEVSGHSTHIECVLLWLSSDTSVLEHTETYQLGYAIHCNDVPWGDDEYLEQDNAPSHGDGIVQKYMVQYSLRWNTINDPDTTVTCISLLGIHSNAASVQKNFYVSSFGKHDTLMCVWFPFILGSFRFLACH